MRIGLGYDIHRLVPGRKLIIGGVTIPYDRGLLGHSDADVLLHAIGDAILGAAGMEDIGSHFPDTEDEYRGIDSAILADRIVRLIHSQGLTVANVDSTIFAERPKMAPHRDAIRHRIAEILRIPPSRVNVKATTTEGLGLIGSGEAIAAMCVVLIQDFSQPGA